MKRWRGPEKLVNQFASYVENQHKLFQNCTFHFKKESTSFTYATHPIFTVDGGARAQLIKDYAGWTSTYPLAAYPTVTLATLQLLEYKFPADHSRATVFGSLKAKDIVPAPLHPGRGLCKHPFAYLYFLAQVT